MFAKIKKINIRQFLSKKENLIFLAILLVGVLLRSYKAVDWFQYGHDHDLNAWIVRDIVEGHPRLIGQETSSKGVFIGPIFYYLTIPFYLLGNWDPAATLILPILISIFGIWSVYFTFTKLFNNKVGLIGSLIYSLSYLIIFTDREVVPTMPVMVWSVWFFYAITNLLKGNQKSYILIGFLLGLVWHLNLALALLTPIVLIAQLLSKTRINIKNLLIGILLFFILMLPFVVFEMKHNYQQIFALKQSFTGSKDYVEGTGRGIAKLDRVFQLINRNTTTLYWGLSINVPAAATFYLLVVSFIALLVRGNISKSLAVVMIFWQILFVLFFTLNSINPSEYYFNGMNIVWIIVLSLAISNLLAQKYAKYLGVGLLCIFVFANMYAYSRRTIDKNGYAQRKELVEFIAQDSRNHNYPCVSVSFITSPGNNMGYRHLFFMNKLHVNQPKSESPVYTIVFPHSMVDRLDKSFGSLGLVLPNYERYNEKDVKESCAGGNANLTDPMFGFTN